MSVEIRLLHNVPCAPLNAFRDIPAKEIEMLVEVCALHLAVQLTLGVV